MRARRMARVLPCIAVALLLNGPEVRADYGELMLELDAYQPPPVVVGQMTERVERGPSDKADSDEYEKQVAALQKQLAHWQRTLQEPQGTESFLEDPPDLRSSLQPAVQDASFTAKALGNGFALGTLEMLVLLRSPEVKSKEGEFQAVLEGYSQVESLDTILRRYASFTKSVMTGVGGMSNPDPVAQKFPFPGVLALKGEVVNQEAAAALQAVEVARREAVTAARREFAELCYLHQAEALTRGQIQLLNSLQATASSRYQSGSTTFQEVTGISIELEKQKEELITLGELRKNSEAAIRALLVLPAETTVGIPSAGALHRGLGTVDALTTQALARRQEIRGVRAMIARSERMLELSESMIYPGFSQGLAVFEGDELSRVAAEFPKTEEGMAGNEGSFPDTATASTGSGLPKMPWFGTDDAYLRQVRQRISNLYSELAATQAATTLGVRKAWFAVNKALREESLYRERVKPLAKTNLDSASQGYAAGKVEFSQLIDAAGGWLTAGLGQARAEADLRQAQAELDAAVGVSTVAPRKH